MKKITDRNPGILISIFGLIALGTAFIHWWTGSTLSTPALFSAIASTALFAGVCLRFVPVWMKFWQNPVKKRAAGDTPRLIELKIFVTLLLMHAAVLGAVYLLRWLIGYHQSFGEHLEFWRCLDSNSYLEISKDWYAAEGDRRLQLVFLPGYPIVVHLAAFLVGSELYAGLLVSMLSFAAAGCMFYRLMRLDHNHAFAVRALKYLCIVPGTFFYTAPMTESLFLLLCVSCIYFARTGRWTLGCLLGGYAAFTRSLGATLLAPLVMELVHARGSGRTVRRRVAALPLVPLGLIAYFVVNYLVSGDPFMFQKYQSEHWHQHLGWFFNTASYQMQRLIDVWSNTPFDALGLWAANLICCFSGLLLVFFAARKLRPSYTAWFIGYYFMAIGATWLLSAPRYLLPLFPISVAMASLTRKPGRDQLLTVCTVALNLLYLFAFAARWQVW